MVKNFAKLMGVIGLLFSFSAQATERFPIKPNALLTPGETCSRPDSYRYPERIPYCSRSVSTETKQFIIRKYDRDLGYSIGSMPRADFKIDHYIPLCMGGNNAVANLWPQHKSVFEVTDPLEGRLCEMMAEGRLSQAEAIAKLKHAKDDLNEARRLWEEIR